MKYQRRPWTRWSQPPAASTLDGWCAIGAWCCVMVLALATTLLFTEGVTVGLLPVFAVALPWIIVASCALPLLLQRLPLPPRRRRDLEILWNCLFALVLLLFLGPLFGLTVVLLPMGLIAVLARHSQGDTAASAAAYSSAVLTLVLTADLDRGSSFALRSAALVCTLTTLLWVQARRGHRQWAATRGSSSIAESASPVESPGGVRSRVMLGLVTAAILALVFVTGERLAQGSPATDRFDDSTKEVSAGDPEDRDESTAALPSGWGGVDQGEGVGIGGAPVHRVFPEQLRFGASLGRATHGRIMEVRVLEPLADQRAFDRATPLYLKARHFTRYDANGLAAAENGLIYDDLGDGHLDGWVDLAPLANTSSTRLLQIRQRPLRPSGRAPDLDRSLLHWSAPLLAVWAPEVRWAPDSQLVVDHPSLELVVYSIEVGANQVDPLLLDDDAWAPLSEPPPLTANWSQVLAAVQREVAGLDDSTGKVRSLLQHFRSRFHYSLDTGDPGPQALVDFLQTRQGYCTHFATAMVLALRTWGIPARVVGGYRITEWNEQAKAYVAGGGTAHSWVEIQSRDHGWLPIDPTPGRQVDEAVDHAERDYQEVLTAWLAAQGALEDDPDDAAPTDPQAAEVLQSDSKWTGQLPALPWLIGISTILLGLALLTGLGEKRRREAPKVEDPVVARGIRAYRHLCRDLARHGLPKARHQTPREHADAVRAATGDALDTLPMVIHQLYRLRFGEASAEALAAFPQLVARCRAQVRGLKGH